MKLPYLSSTILSDKLSKGMGHNYYGEAGWPNDILYIRLLEILPDWYLFGTFNLLRILSDKFMGILSILVLASVLLVIPVFENLSTNQNPIRRACILSIFLSAVIYSIWLEVVLVLNPLVERFQRNLEK